MHIQPCLHPVVSRNKYTGQEFVGACGHCPACLNNRANHWVTRLDLEDTCHKYNWFVTFTYDEQHIDQIVRLRYEDYKDGVAYINSDTGEIYEFSHSSIRRHNKKDFEFCKNTKVLPILNKSDVQKFVKLLRYYIKQIDPNASLRYFITGELGPTTIRPHLHGKFWFDSETIDKNFTNLLFKAWKYGHIHDPHHITGSASSYVAAYCNEFTDLPSIYQHRALRPFHLCSKCPPIGTLVPNLKNVPEILERKDTTFKVFSKSSGKFFDVPLWRSILDRYYPRIQRFSSLTLDDRITLYGLAEKHYFEDKFKFAEFLYYYYVRARKLNSFVADYLHAISHVPKNRVVFSRDGLLFKSIVSDLETNINSIVRFASILLRVRAQASAFGISISDYVIKISDYYEKIESVRFNEYMRFQDDYFKTHPLRDYLLLDAAFVKRVNGKPLSCLKSSDVFYLQLYGVIDDSTKVVRLSFDDCAEYRQFAYDSFVRFSNLTKSKKANDEVYKLKDNFKEIQQTYLL